MSRSVVAVTGTLGQSTKLPSWGKSFWQDPNDGELIVLYASGNTEVDYVYSSDSGNNWSSPQVAFYVDNFSIHDNFDSAMDDGGNVHCAHRYASSGCYTFLAKDYVSGGWTPSGVVGRGFTSAGDIGPAKGFNGSIEITNTFLGPFGGNDVAGPFPVARIAAKDSSNTVNLWFVPNTFTSYPILDSLSPINTIFNAGEAGGFPIFNGAGSAGRQVLYSVDATGIVQVNRAFFSWTYRTLPIKDPFTFTFGTTTPEASGYFSRIPFGPSMSYIDVNAFTGPPSDRKIASQQIILTNSRNNLFSQWDLLTCTVENQLAFGLEDSGFNIANTLVRLPSIGTYAGIGTNVDRATPLNIPLYSSIPGDINSKIEASGTLSDMSWNDENNTINLYFLINEDNGQQSISRMKMSTERDFSGAIIGGNAVARTRAQYHFSESITSSVSGLRPFATAGRDYTGGSGLLLNWNNFKALRHRATQFENTVSKQDAVVTEGSGLDGISRVVFWDFNKSIEGVNPTTKLPTYVQHRTLDSGNNETFVGPSSSVGITSTDLVNLFDDNTATSGSISNGDSVTLEFTTQQVFNRLEVLWNDTSSFPSNSFFEMNIDASLDGVSFTRVASIPARSTGFSAGTVLEKYTSELDPVDVDLAGTAKGRIDAFVAKFVKLSFGGAPTGPYDVREIRLYGAHNTAGGWRTSGDQKEFFLPPLVVFGRKEEFNTTREGELPQTWTTYGDFDWFVRASGSYSDFEQNGFVDDSGIFKGTKNGRNDGFAARTSTTGVPKSPVTKTSGILEVSVSVDASEVAFDGSSGRTVAFDIRHDVVVETPVITLADSNDDQIYFETVSDTGVARVYYPARLPQNINEFCGTNICPSYTRFRTTIPTGDVTLRWVYERGLKAADSTIDNTVVWIDNVDGVSPIRQTAIAGYTRGSAFSTNTFTGDSGIWGFLNSKGALSLPAYMNSTTAAITGSVGGYIKGVTFASGAINSYMNAFGSESIGGYIKGNRFNSSVNAYLLNSGVAQSINAYIKNSAFESIAAFVKAPSGNAAAINAYMLTPEFLSVYGYIKGPIPATGSIGAFLQANGYQNSINSYMLASGLPSYAVNAYLLNVGAEQQINGYLPRGDNHQVAAFVKGAIPQSGVINAWISGVSVANQNVNAYLMGISGVASGSMNGYMVGVEAPNGDINGYLVGFGNDAQCDFPLPSLPTITIPSGNFFN